MRDRNSFVRSFDAISCPGAVVLVFTVSAGLIVSACSALCLPEPPRLRETAESKGGTGLGQEMNAGGAAELKEKVQGQLQEWVDSYKFQDIPLSPCSSCC